MESKERTSSLSKRDERFLERALELAKLSTCRQKHGAIIVKGGRVLSVGINANRNDPTHSYPSHSLSTHAEAAALKAIRGDECRGSKIYVARLLRNDSSGLSRPCDLCYLKIRRAGIKEIIYTT